MREFAEQEIILPTGPHEGRRFSCDRNPWNGLYLDQIDSGNWTSISLTAMRQGGKTLIGSAIPVCYHLFELRETVIYAVPTTDMAMDKWNRDLLPVIKSSRYADMIPKVGSGSRGGEFVTIQFANGAVLRFMTGGGSDKSRAGFTARVIVETETDGMDESGGKSDETDKLTQIEGCCRAYGSMKRIYRECTASTESGRIWREVTGGTNSRIYIKCQHCGEYVLPERNHFAGWQTADTENEAAREAHLICPSCGTAWSEDDRKNANRDCRIVHAGQTIDRSGIVHGPVPDTKSFGLRVSFVNNLLEDQSVVGVDEWKASRAADTDLAERQMLQYVWAMPYSSEATTLTTQDSSSIARRTISYGRGVVPDDATFITVGMDQGKRLCHWVAFAWRNGVTPHIIDYGRQEVASDEIEEEKALLLAMRDFRDTVLKQGWKTSNGTMTSSLSFFDRGWLPGVVTKFCEESENCFPSFGLGVRRFGGLAGEKRDTGTIVKAVKDGYMLVTMPTCRKPVIEVNSDHWKSWIHSRLNVKTTESGALTLYQSPPHEHLWICKHFVAEKKEEEFVAGKGLVTRWVAINRNNHGLDAAALAACAGQVYQDENQDQNKPIQAIEDNAIPVSDFASRKQGRW